MRRGGQRVAFAGQMKTNFDERVGWSSPDEPTVWLTIHWQ
jgi:hypothetical protein